VDDCIRALPFGGGGRDELQHIRRCKKPGISDARLARIALVVQARLILSGRQTAVPADVVAIAKGGKLAYLQAIGFQDRPRLNDEEKCHLLDRPMSAGDQVPMILGGAGKLDLQTHPSTVLPELGDMRVAVERRTGHRRRNYGLGLANARKNAR